MAEKKTGKITQVISAVLDIKFPEGQLPEINEAIDIPLGDDNTLVVEVAQHLGDDIVRCVALGPTDGLKRVWKQSLPDLPFRFLSVKQLWDVCSMS